MGTLVHTYSGISPCKIIQIWDRCYDFKNIFAEKFSEKIGVYMQVICRVVAFRKNVLLYVRNMPLTANASFWDCLGLKSVTTTAKCLDFIQWPPPNKVQMRSNVQNFVIVSKSWWKCFQFRKSQFPPEPTCFRHFEFIFSFKTHVWVGQMSWKFWKTKSLIKTVHM
jgi:hypothetical protein